MKSVTTITFDDRKATTKKRIAEYERTWNTFVGIISRLDVTHDDDFGIGPEAFAKSEKEFLIPYHSSIPTWLRISRAKMAPMTTRCPNSSNMCLYANKGENRTMALRTTQR